MSKHGPGVVRSLRISSEGHVGSVQLEGHDISNATAGLDIRMRPGCLPEVRLDVILYDLTSEVETTVTVPDATRDLLVRLGWTPPAEEAQS